MSTATTTALPAGLTTGTWAVDASHTEAAFTVRHAGISKVRGTVARHRGHRRRRRGPREHLGLRHAGPVHRQHRRRQPRRPPQERRLLRRGEVRPVDLRLHRGPRGAATNYVIAGDLTIHGVTQAGGARDRVQRHRGRPVRQHACGLRGQRRRSPARTSASPGTRRSRPAACWCPTRSSSRSTCRPSRADPASLTAGSRPRRGPGRSHAQAPVPVRRRSWNARICSSEATSTARRSTCGGTFSAGGRTSGCRRRRPRPARRTRPARRPRAWR